MTNKGSWKLGRLFNFLCDEVNTIDLAVALEQLVYLINGIATKVGRKLPVLIKRQSNTGLLGCQATSRLICQFQTVKVKFIILYPLSITLGCYDFLYSIDILLDCARKSAKVAKIAIVTPSEPIQVIEVSDTFSTKIPPIPAPAAIASCIID